MKTVVMYIAPVVGFIQYGVIDKVVFLNKHSKVEYNRFNQSGGIKKMSFGMKLPALKGRTSLKTWMEVAFPLPPHRIHHRHK